MLICVLPVAGALSPVDHIGQVRCISQTNRGFFFSFLKHDLCVAMYVCVYIV